MVRKSINDNIDINYYHGLSTKFMFPSLKRDFNIPTSLSTDIDIALDFAAYDGIVMQNHNGIYLMLYQLNGYHDSKMKRKYCYLVISIKWLFVILY